MNIIDFHVIGGIQWMLTLLLLLVINLILIARAFMNQMRQKSVNQKQLMIIKQIGGFALAFGAFSTLVGFFQAFGDLSTMKEMIPTQVIYGGLQVALITLLYGLGIFLFSMMCVIVLNWMKKD